MNTKHEAVVGEVESWRDEDGWGVLRTPNGLSVFCHCSQLDMAGSPSLTPGTSIYFDYEQPGQDGCDARVLTAARVGVASGENPPLRSPNADEISGSTAYGSGLIIVWDDGAPS